MNISKTIENITAKCDNYIDPNLSVTIIHDNYTTGSNNIGKLDDDNYTQKVLKTLKHENIFITFGMFAFIPILNECDIFSINDTTIKLTQEEFDKYGNLKEGYFGILIKKDSQDYIIGSCDLCGCSIDASFKEIEKEENIFYNTINQIIKDNIIF